MDKPKPSLLIPAAIFIACFGMLVLKTLWPYLDPDTWWHLRVGQWIVEHRAVPWTDPFSQIGVEQATPWLAYSWLFEVLLYGIYTSLGLSGMVLYRVVMGCLILAALTMLAARRRPEPSIAAGGLALAFMSLLLIFTERPWMFTILFSILTFEAVLELREGTARRAVWFLPAIYVLWANIHIQFVYGLFILGWACAAPVLDRLLGIQNEVPDTKQPFTQSWWRLVGLTGACFLATFVNPYGPGLYRIVLEYASQPAPFRLVDELTPPTFRNASDWAGLALLGVGAFALGRLRKLTSFEVVLLAVAAIFAFRAKRDVWFVAMTGLAFLAQAFPARQPLDVRIRPLAVACGLLVAMVTVVAGWRAFATEARLTAFLKEKAPFDAVAYVKEKQLAGPLYNDFGWGGYLIWWLPELPVSIDGRTNLFGDERLLRSSRTTLAQPGWQDDPDLARARLLILPKTLPLVDELRTAPGFRLAYEDAVAAVFVAKP